jgi:hypothetical protein
MKRNYPFMKSTLTIFLLTVLLSACSSDDNSSDNPIENGMILSKTVKYYPSKSEYDLGVSNILSLKTVSHYENGHIITDTIYNMQGNVFRRSTYSYSGNTSTMTKYTGNNEAMEIRTCTYDAQGRISYIVYNYPAIAGGIANENEIEITYESDSVLYTVLPNPNPIVFDLNAFGIINNLGNSSSTTNQDKLLAYNYPNSNAETVYNYLEGTVPANWHKSVNELNNAIILNGLESLAFDGNYYLESTDLRLFDKTFNSNNYLVHDKSHFIDPSSYSEDYIDEWSYETFYYYN